MKQAFVKREERSADRESCDGRGLVVDGGSLSSGFVEYPRRTARISSSSSAQATTLLGRGAGNTTAGPRHQETVAIRIPAGSLRPRPAGLLRRLPPPVAPSPPTPVAPPPLLPPVTTAPAAGLETSVAGRRSRDVGRRSPLASPVAARKQIFLLSPL